MGKLKEIAENRSEIYSELLYFLQNLPIFKKKYLQYKEITIEELLTY